MKKTSENIFEPEMPVVPSGWNVLPFQKAVDVVSDKGKRVKQREYLSTGNIPVIDQGQEIIGGYTNDEDMAFDGELPVILFGDHTRSVKYVDKRFAVGADGVKILRPMDAYTPKFLYYLLRSLQIPSRGYSRHFQFLRKFHLPFAPDEQQKGIVAEIEKQFSRLDEAVANLKRIKANLKRYKAAVLKAAVEGKLTEAWRKAHPDVEPASKLLDRVLMERRLKTKKVNFEEQSGIETTTNGWVSAAIGLVCEIVDGDRGSNYPKKSDFHSAGHCLFLSTKNVRPNGFLFEDNQFISKEKHAQLHKGTLERGDIVFTSRGTIGNLAHYDEVVPYEHVRINSGMFILRGFNDLLDEKYFEWYLRSAPIRSQIDKLKSGTAQPQLPIREFRSFRILFPSRKEQGEINREIERRLSVIEELLATVAANLTRAGRLRQSILNLSFKGKLFDTIHRRES